MVIGEPPSDAGAEKVTDACVLPPVAVPIVGTPGTVTGVAVAVALALPCPAEFTAETLKSYEEPFVRPVTVVDVAVETPSANVDHVEVAESL